MCVYSKSVSVRESEVCTCTYVTYVYVTCMYMYINKNVVCTHNYTSCIYLYLSMQALSEELQCSLVSPGFVMMRGVSPNLLSAGV